MYDYLFFETATDLKVSNLFRGDVCKRQGNTTGWFQNMARQQRMARRGQPAGHLRVLCLKMRDCFLNSGSRTCNCRDCFIPEEDIENLKDASRVPTGEYPLVWFQHRASPQERCYEDAWQEERPYTTIKQTSRLLSTFNSFSSGSNSTKAPEGHTHEHICTKHTRQMTEKISEYLFPKLELEPAGQVLVLLRKPDTMLPIWRHINCILVKKTIIYFGTGVYHI